MDPVLDDAAGEAIRRALDPRDRWAPAHVLDRGFGSLAVRFGGTVARIPANAEVAASHARELRTLPVLVDRLPVAVPAPVRAVPSEPGLPFGALLHPWLAGTVMTEDDAVLHDGLADEIAACLAALHAIEPSAFPDGSCPEMDPAPKLAELLSQTDAWLRRRLDGAQRSRLASLAERAFAVLPDRERAVNHADPWFGNMLLDGAGHLSGLVDFEGLCLADPAYDLAAQTYLTPPSADRTIAAYIDRTGPLPDLEGRVQSYLLMRELWGLAYAIRNDLIDEAEHAYADVLGLLA